MILPFQTKINGKTSYFVEKIWAGLENHCVDSFYNEGKKTGKYDFDDNWSLPPKIHTIREDKTNRWQVGKMIDFYINNRTKKAFCFAPSVPIISIQSIYIHHTISSAGTPLVYIEIDKRCFDTYNVMDKISAFKNIEKLAQNDGFDSVEDFLNYFNGDFKGKIIHWTNFKYY